MLQVTGSVSDGREPATTGVEPVAGRTAAAGRISRADAYGSLTFHNEEDLAVWSRGWICVGFADAIPEVGDLLPFTVGTHGLHIQHTAEGFAGRFNKAQHGGCRAVPLQCRTGTKTPCSFTSCGYSRDRTPISGGELRDGTPEMHQYLGLRPERLLPVPVHRSGPLLFTSLDAQPAPFDAAVAAAIDETSCFPRGRTQSLALHRLETRGNWKLVAQGLLGAFAPSSERADMLVGRTIVGGRPLGAAWLFPNLVLLSTAQHTCSLVLQPTAIGQTLLCIGIHGDGDAFVTNSRPVLGEWSNLLAPLLRRAEADQEAALRWSGQGHLAIDDAEWDRPQAAWLQRRLARKMQAVSPEAFDLQRFLLQGQR